MSITTDVIAYKASVDTKITTKDQPNTIPPDVVGDAFNDLADLLEQYYGNNFNVLSGTGVPNNADGADIDLYFRNNNPIEVYQKEGGIWVLKATLDLGIVFPDGPLIGLQTAISGFDVMVTSGGWTINNVIYRKDIATGFTLSPADLNFGRYDLIYADTNNDILIEEGTPSSTPAIPTLSSNTVMVDVAFIPASSSGQSPYLLYGNNTGAAAVPFLKTGTFNGSGEASLASDPVGSFPIVTVYDSNGLQSPVQYDNTNKKLIGGNPGEAFTARFI